jgi:hypothetical protein
MFGHGLDLINGLRKQEPNLEKSATNDLMNFIDKRVSQWVFRKRLLEFLTGPETHKVEFHKPSKDLYHCHLEVCIGTKRWVALGMAEDPKDAFEDSLAKLTNGEPAFMLESACCGVNH